MTTLQRLSFERIQKINNCLKDIFPFKNHGVPFTLSDDQLNEIGDLIYEQKELLDALDEEDRRR